MCVFTPFFRLTSGDVLYRNESVFTHVCAASTGRYFGRSFRWNLLLPCPRMEQIEGPSGK